MKIIVYRTIGIILILTGIGMFFLGAWVFTSQGSSLSSIVSKAGEYSFFLWLPVGGGWYSLTICF